MSKFENPIGYTGRKATQERSGQAKFATNAQAAAGLAKDLMISPLSMAGAVDDLVPDASLTQKGIVELATAAEMLAGVDTGRVPAVNVAFDYINSVAIAGAPAWSESVSGIGQLSTNAEAVAFTNDTTAMTPLKVAAVFASPPSLGSAAPAAGSFTTLAASGLASLSASATILTAGTALNLGSDNSGDAINLGSGSVARAIGIGNSAAAHVISIGSLTGASQVILNSGTAGIQLASTGAGDITINSDDTLLLDADGVLEINSSAGVIGIGSDADANNINIGTGAAARTITVGNSTGATSVVLNCGTGALNLGTNAIAHSTTIGNKTGASALVLETGTGNFSLDGVGASTYSIGASATSGTIQIGVGAQTGTMTLGDSSGTNIVEIGSGEGSTTVAIAGGATNAKTVTIANGAVANLVTIGSASGAASMDLLCGTGNFTLEGATASTYEISSTGVNTGTVKLASGTGARTVEIAGGGTGIKTINIGAAATADVITIGSTDGAGSLTLAAGSGKVLVTATQLALTTAASQLQVEGGAVTDFIGQSTLTAGTVTVLNTNIAATDRVFVTRSDVNGSTALGLFDVSITASTSFVIDARKPADATVETNDVSIVDWFIVRQL